MAESKSGYRAALSHLDFRLLMARASVSGIGSWAYNVGLVVYIYDKTQSPGWVAAATLGRFIPALIASPYGGVLAEKFERRRVLLVSDIAATVLMALLALVAFMDGPVLLILVLATFTTISGIVDQPANSALVPQVVGEDDLAAANGLNSSIENLSVLAGPALGAVLLIIGDPTLLFTINAVTFALGGYLVTRIRTRSTATDVTEGGQAGFFKQLSVGFRAIGTSKTAAILVAFSVLASFVYGTDTVLFALLGERIGIGADGYGYLLAGLGAGGLLAAGLVNKLAAVPRLGVVITAGMIVYSVPTALLAFIDNAQVAIALQVVRGAGTLVVDVLAVTALQRTLAPELIARVFGVFWSLVIAAIALGAAVMPPVLGLTGLDNTLLIVGLGIPVLVLATGPWLLAMDRTAVARLAELEPRIRLLEVLGIFAGASRPILERLAASATEVEAEPGTVVIREGEPADALYVLSAGEVAVIARGEGRSARRVATINALSYFGEIGLLRQIPRTATVKALSPITMLRIDGDDFLNALSGTTAAPAFLESARARLARTRPSLAAQAEAEPQPQPTPSG